MTKQPAYNKLTQKQRRVFGLEYTKLLLLEIELTGWYSVYFPQMRP